MFQCIRKDYGNSFSIPMIFLYISEVSIDRNKIKNSSVIFTASVSFWVNKNRQWIYRKRVTNSSESKSNRRWRLVFKHHKMTRAGVTQETCDAASKCLNRNNSDPDDRADKIQPFEGMVKVTVTSASDALVN